MPFDAPTGLAKRRTRVLIYGAPNAGKTHSLLTFPGPAFDLNYPGEKGYETLLTVNAKGQSVPVRADMDVRWYTPDKLTVKANSAQILAEVEKFTVQALATPGLQTFCGDGLHKLMAYAMDAMSGGAYFAGDPTQTASGSNQDVLDPRVYGQAERWLFGYLNTVMQSAVPYVVFTCWDADKQIRRASKAKGEKWSDVPTQTMPALFGQTGKAIMGEFSIVLHASRGMIDPKAVPPLKGYRWQTVGDADVVAGIKAPVSVTSRIPKFVPADWAVLGKYLGVSNDTAA